MMTTNQKNNLYFDDNVPEFNIFHADNMDEVNGHYVDVYNPNNEIKEKKDTNSININDDEQKEKFNETVPKIGGFLAGEELFERQANEQGFEEEEVIITEPVQINFFIDLMQIYSLNEAMDDFIQIYENEQCKTYILSFLDLDRWECKMFGGDKLQMIMSLCSTHNQIIYLFTLHFIICRILKIPKPKKQSVNISYLHPKIYKIFYTMSDIPRLNENLHLFETTKEQNAIKLLLRMNQKFIFSKWDKAGINDSKKKEFIAQIIKLDNEYPNGLYAYYTNAKKLISKSAKNENAFTDFDVSSPNVINLEFGTNAFEEYETSGFDEFGHCGFVLLGGGFGERLSYNGIKTGLPSDISSNTSYIELYIRTLLAFQTRARTKLNNSSLLLPFACTTSGRGHDDTVKLLKKNNYFGLDSDKGQCTLLRQNLVASFANNECDFALDESGYKIIEKPHGHGDVHSLMYQSGTAMRWKEQYGLKWIVFLQDTNAIAIRCLASAIGVSVKHNFAMNSIATPRKPKQAYGAICKLIQKETQRELTLNVEYNQLSALFSGAESVSMSDENAMKQYPANTNTLIIRSDTYCKVLTKTKGQMPEFVNPKYANDERTKFIKATRLECMMQDYPKLLFEEGFFKELIGVTSLPKWMALQAVKKNIFDCQKEAMANDLRVAEFAASSGEASVYYLNRRYVNECGVLLEGERMKMFAGINVKYGARIVLMPSFGVTLSEIKQRLVGRDNIKISERSTLILDGDIVIKRMELNGTLIVRAMGKNTKIVIDGLKVDNKGWEFVEIADLNDEKVNDVYKMRGYELRKNEERVIQFDDGKEHVVYK